MKMLFNLSRLVILGFITRSLLTPCFALELEPRQWSHLPLGTNFVGVGYAYTEADIAVDPTLLLENVKMELQTLAGKFIRTFEFLDKSARIDLTQAYQTGNWTGLLNGAPASASRSGWSDTFLRFAVNLYGAPPLSGKDYAAYRSSDMRSDTVVGIALAVRLPTGEYMDDKLINLGQNRFTFRPQIGVNHTYGKWTTELTGQIAFFTENDEFFNGKTLNQDPLYIVTGHLIYSFRPGLWLGASLGYDYGGENIVNGIDKNDKSQDIGWALSYSYPINRNSGINIKYVGTRTQESTGMDTDTVTAGFTLSW